jgi:hypothetical protein
MDACSDGNLCVLWYLQKEPCCQALNACCIALQVPRLQLAMLLRRLFLRLVCLLTDNATTASMALPSPELLLVSGLR